MAEAKSKKTELTVEQFLDSVADPKRREECRVVYDLMSKASGEAPRIWQGSIVGFGSYHYKGKSRCEGDWFLTGFSPRKANLTLYILPSVESYAHLTDKLGKFTTGVSCLYLKKLEDVDLKILARLVKESVARMRKQPPGGVGT